MQGIFDKKLQLNAEGQDAQVELQMLEVYNEKVRDLLAPTVSGQKGKKGEDRHWVEVRVHPKLGVYVKGASENRVTSLREMLDLIEYGSTMKTIAATAMNKQSSPDTRSLKLL
jgi:hypothetical protein